MDIFSIFYLLLAVVQLLFLIIDMIELMFISFKDKYCSHGLLIRQHILLIRCIVLDKSFARYNN